MSSLLYYSISSDLTKDEMLEIDKQVAKNQEAVFLFIKKLPSNSKVKAKKLFVYGIFLSQFGQPLAPFIIAKKLTKEIITEAIQPYAENDSYWLELYYFARKII